MHGALPSLADRTLSNVGRRAAARLRLALPATLVTIYEVRPCILANLSETGAQIGIEKPLNLGDAAFLKCAGIDQFATIVRSKQGVNALQFEVPLTSDQVLAIRSVSENFDEIERRGFRRMAREWITGGR